MRKRKKGTDKGSRHVSKVKILLNRKHKDSVFRMLFNDKENLLSLYNAINGSDYTDPDDLEITTIGDAVYIGHNKKLMEKCRILYEYAEFVATMREYLETALNFWMRAAVRAKSVEEFVEETQL